MYLLRLASCPAVHAEDRRMPVPTFQVQLQRTTTIEEEATVDVDADSPEEAEAEAASLADADESVWTEVSRDSTAAEAIDCLELGG